MVIKFFYYGTFFSTMMLSGIMLCAIKDMSMKHYIGCGAIMTLLCWICGYSCGQYDAKTKND